MRCHRHLRRARGEDDSPAAVEGEVDALLAALADRTGRAQSHPRGAGAIPRARRRARCLLCKWRATARPMR